MKKHPEAEKLYLEEIDVGEDAPRQIISGVVPMHHTIAYDDRLTCIAAVLCPQQHCN